MPEPMEKPVSRVDFGHIAEKYEDTRGVPAALMQELIDDIIGTTELTKDKILLDIGCGTGRFLREFTEQNIPMVGIDISKKMLELACEQQNSDHSKLNFIVGDAVTLPFPNDVFNVYLAIHLFHLLPDWKQVLTEGQRVLQSDGFLITGFVDSPIRASRLYEMYNNRRNELGYPSVLLGAHTSEVMEELKERGATLETHEFSTKTSIPFQYALDCLEQQVFSSMWHNMPGVIHRQLMTELKEYTTSQFRSPDETEDLEIVAAIHYAQF
jgi:ubiquinone/menaquinone biosynthesis C-methylase UbiE